MAVYTNRLFCKFWERIEISTFPLVCLLAVHASCGGNVLSLGFVPLTDITAAGPCASYRFYVLLFPGIKLKSDWMVFF